MPELFPHSNHELKSEGDDIHSLISSFAFKKAILILEVMDSPRYGQREEYYKIDAKEPRVLLE